MSRRERMLAHKLEVMTRERDAWRAEAMEGRRDDLRLLLREMSHPVMTLDPLPHPQSPKRDASGVARPFSHREAH